jgi:hypothetical protein
MGGLFGLYTLFNHHGFFRRYVIGSPEMDWDYPRCFDYEANYAAGHKDLDAIVFLSAGGAERVLSATLEHFHLLCSVLGAKKEALAVGDGNGLKGGLGGQEQ